MPRHSLIFVTAFLVGAPFAHANTLRYKVGPLPFATVADGSSADLDPAADAIRILINRTVTVGGATYRVSGYVSAVASPPVTGKPALIVESLQIRNMAGNVIAGTLVVEHQFSANDNITYNDSLSGEFDNVVAPGWLNGGSLADPFGGRRELEDGRVGVHGHAGGGRADPVRVRGRAREPQEGGPPGTELHVLPGFAGRRDPHRQD